MSVLDTRIAQWRVAILRGSAITENDADELEGHLREQSDDLVAVGLSEDEAFLVAIRRLGEVDRITAEFAREHHDRLWKQLVLSGEGAGEGGGAGRRHSLTTMLAFAVLAGVVTQVARVSAFATPELPSWVLINVGFFVLPVLAAYFAVERKISARVALVLGVVTAMLAVAVNLFPFPDGSQASVLVAIHLPVLLWFIVGVAYVGGELRSSAGRMNFVRFSGEWAIYYVLLALGGAVLIGLTVLVLEPIAPEAIEEVIYWVLPSGAAGAVIVAAWLVESKKSVIENLAPVLTAIFTPLFAVMLLGAAVSYLAVGIQGEFDRDMLLGFDALLLVVLGLVVYGISARKAGPGSASGQGTRFSDVARLVAICAALLLDVIVLGAMLARVGDLGFTPNRVVALGLNLVLLVNLAVTAGLSVRMLVSRGTALSIERWQTEYLTVFAVWASAVVLLLPPLFGFA